MDDYTSNILNDSKNEWSILLINYITPHIIDGFKAIFNESIHLCESNDEIEKYLMTFQNLLSRIPKWNQTIVLAEQDRIIKSCNCSYLEDLITCVHIIQLKILSCVRVGNETKKITIDIPDTSSFIHQIYINIARKLYSNIYLFEIDIPPLEQQRRNREFELLVQTCIMNTIRDKIPVETLLRQFIDETQEIEVTRVEKTLNTTAKSLESPNSSNVSKPTNIMNENLNEIIHETVEPMQSKPVFQPSFNNINENMNQSNQSMNQSNQSMNQSNQFSNENVDESRKSTITFNSEPSILEIENSNFNLDSDEIKLGDSSISFEDLDSDAPLNLEFEEL
jgi:hypothetical protein